MTSLSEFKNIRTDQRKIALSRGAEIVFDREPNQSKRNNDFLHPGECLIAAVRTLMYGYVIVSSRDPEGQMWCDLDAGLSHISTVEHFLRLNTKNGIGLRQKIVDAEMAVRMEWTRVQQLNPDMSLSEIISTVTNRHTIWPSIGEFRTKAPVQKEWQKGDAWPTKTCF